MNFKIPSKPPTINKTIRFPSTLVSEVEKMIQNQDCTFSSFVIAATQAAVENLQKQEKKNPHP